ncbi:helix-turn-helix domain-containing protein [Vibrio sp. JC009]|uniref:winged helix-turn-helix domain-containing protein n=1 Tax=Vibrio sp. JC009 TaxID=2912314 RepID=UPI0023AEE15F|nr:helix-turn-helix domain-containing protein [Vibrio sp. JC009]WED24094.1 helix-turn-helix domain-containing protein [Vibrio sp. JC009]
MRLSQMKYKLAENYVFYPEKNSLVDCLDENEFLIGNNESRLLLLLLQNHGQVVTRAHIQKFVWEDLGFRVDSSSLTQAVSNLRKTLGDSPQSPRFITTVPKIGYKFISPVDKLIPDSAIAEEILPVGIKATSEVSDSRFQVKPFTEKLKNWRPGMYMLLALLFPFATFGLMSPAKPNYVAIDTVNGISVKSLEGNIIGEHWVKPLKQCVSWYFEHQIDGRLPDEIIAVAGMENKLILNYVYSQELSHYNFTMHLLADKGDRYSLCSKEDNYVGKGDML